MYLPGLHPPGDSERDNGVDGKASGKECLGGSGHQEQGVVDDIVKQYMSV